ncbi:MAG: NTP transferase domain-containing protein [Acidobacteria bacterium]|nr:NTP transferase domain-containing protein [Acidobacteriota bacterium]
MKAVILAAGRGSRLDSRPVSKPLCPVNGRALIEWVILAAHQAGIAEFVVVTGYAREALERHLRDFSRGRDFNITCVPNDDWAKENGLSVCAARNHVGDRFVLLMSDHIFDADILARLIAQPLGDADLMLAVDDRLLGNPTVDLDDVTRVLVEDGLISKIGKGLPSYNAFDTGIFFCTSALFAALGDSQQSGDFSLTGGVRVLAERRRAGAMNIFGGFWIDVDDERALQKAVVLATS